MVAVNGSGTPSIVKALTFALSLLPTVTASTRLLTLTLAAGDSLGLGVGLGEPVGAGVLEPLELLLNWSQAMAPLKSTSTLNEPKVIRFGIRPSSAKVFRVEILKF